jgi:hypothetical protein
MQEHRRSPRIVSCVPLEVRVVGPDREATTAVVNQHGALILAPEPWPEGTRLAVRNINTGRSTQGRVVWSGGPDADGDYKVGIEFENPATDFWGQVAFVEE